ncbi:hypothetical protein [Leucobacter aridicollis]|uniref:hypothetical protein n=1 Tax=Leucobacter aridicollis TaxID=283878 RepID=UPI000E64D091|nr:hypothetical protein [Leucobacter aridicollis]UTX53096.1 hypothetical protein KI794_15615 [Leucobacter aridicollis]
MRDSTRPRPGGATGPDESTELDDHEGADAFETRDAAQSEPRKGSTERQDEEIITLDTPD